MQILKMKYVNKQATREIQIKITLKHSLTTLNIKRILSLFLFSSRKVSLN